MDIFGDLGTTLLPKAIAALATAAIKPLSSLLSKRSPNAKKMDRRVALSALIFYVYLSLISLPVILIGTIVAVIAGAFTITDAALILRSEATLFWVILHIAMTIISLAAFYLILKKNKRMKALMAQVRETSAKLHRAIHIYVVVSMIVSFTLLCLFGIYLDAAYLMQDLTWFATWLLVAWWVIIAAILIFKTAKPPYETIKIVMQNGTVLSYDCHPKVCKIKSDYIRILKLDDNDNKIITYENHIQKSAIKQIEFL